MHESKPQKVRTFRDLIAWRKGMALARLVYQTSTHLPPSERFGLTNQMRRAAVSIPSNIAEGYARQSLPDYLKHLRIARGSLAELMTQTELAAALGMMEIPEALSEALLEEDRILQGLIRALQRKTNDR